MTGYTSIGDVAARNAERFGPRTAFQDDYGSISFDAFETRAKALRGALGAAGVEKDQRVAFLSRNRIECLEVFLSCDLGVVVVPLNWRLNPEEIAYILRNCNPTVLIIEPEFIAAVEQALDGLPDIEHRLIFSDKADGNWTSYEDFIRHGARAGTDTRSVGESDPACIVYTSGTTGRPKGALLTHGALLVSSVRIGREMLELDPLDVSLAVMPFFHVGGMWFHCFPSFAFGATTIIHSAFRADEVLEAIAEHGVTNVHLAPTMVGDLLDRPETAKAAASLKRIFYAASPMPLTTLKRAMTQFPDSEFYQSYGSTEAGPVTWLGPSDHTWALNRDQARLQSCGRPFDGVEVKLTTESAAALMPGDVGELAVRSNSTMSGYWENPKATAEAIEDGWIATGDLGRCNADGYHFIVDRKNDMIITGGENVYPTEVEDVLCGLPGIAEAAIMGVPDDRWVQRVVACVVTLEGFQLDADSIIHGCKQFLSGYKCPKDIVFVQTLPKNAAGKILRRRLLEAYQSDRDTS